MRKWLLIFLAIGCLGLVQGQVAHLATAPLYNENDLKYVQQYRWRLQGKEMAWGGTLTAAPSKGKFDTLFFDEGKGRGWDTILCLIPTGGNFQFVYNECCGGFYVKSEAENRFPQFEVEFVREGPKPKERHIGEFGSAGYTLGDAKRVLASNSCNSVLQSNITWVGVQQVPAVTRSIPEDSWICLFDEKGNEYQGEPLQYRAGVSQRILFAPFQTGKMVVTWQAGKKGLDFDFQPAP